MVKNSDNDSPFIALCFQRGWNDWYQRYFEELIVEQRQLVLNILYLNSTGSVFGIYNSHTMSLIMEISEQRRICKIGLHKHYLMYYDVSNIYVTINVLT